MMLFLRESLSLCEWVIYQFDEVLDKWRRTVDVFLDENKQKWGKKMFFDDVLIYLLIYLIDLVKEQNLLLRH